jgi:hypothetical protein
LAFAALSTNVASFFKTKEHGFIVSILQQIVFLITNHLPIHLLPDLSYLHYQISGNRSLYSFGHTSNTVAMELIFDIYSSFLQVLVGGINNSEFYALSLDGTSDLSKKEQYNVFVHWLNGGKKMEHFLGLITPSTTTAANLKKELKIFLEERNISLSKLIEITSDGASNMFGVDNGLIAELVKDNPRVLGVSCVAHRLNNVLKRSFEEIQIFIQCEKIMVETINYFNCSPARLFKLKEIQERIYGKEISLATNNQTRWTSLGEVVRSYSNSLSAIFEYLNLYKDSENQSILLNISDPLHIKSVFILDRIFDPICFTFDVVQKSSLTLLEAIDSVELLLQKIKDMCDNPKKVDEEIEKKSKELHSFYKKTGSTITLSNVITSFFQVLKKHFNERYNFLGYILCNNGIYIFNTYFNIII